MTDAPDFGLRRDFYTFAPETLAAELPDFEILREVGKGSMGIVYEARRRADGLRVALKVLPPSLTLTERALARFLREGRIMASIHHPDIVGCHDQQSRGRLHWFVMEFVDGVTLQQRLQVGPLPVRQACAIAARVGRALQFAHQRGVVHRDVKPGNLMLRHGGDDTAVAITDFGLARETGTGSMTESGAIVGTPMYMAPELVLGGSAQASTLGDVYGLGATLYALVTGRPPFDGPTAQSVLKDVLERDPPPPSRLRADLPGAVEAIILKAMEKEPGRRYGSALELAEDLERWLDGRRVLARRPGLPRRAVRFCAQRPLPTLLAALVFAFAAGAWALNRQRGREAMQAALADAERYLAQAATTRDEQDRPRTAAERRDLLQAAVAAASTVIRGDEAFALAWFVRAKAHHRLQQYQAAVADLDQAERLRGPLPEILHFRIDALRQLGDRASVDRLQQDLRLLLELDPGPRTRALVAEHLLELAALAGGAEREATLLTAREVLRPVGDDDPRGAVARARLLELGDSPEAALEAVRELSQRFERDVYVRAQAAAMFERLGAVDDSQRELEMVRLLAGQAEDRAAETPLDLRGVSGFLGEVNRLLQALDGKAAPPAEPRQPDKQ